MVVVTLGIKWCECVQQVVSRHQCTDDCCLVDQKYRGEVNWAQVSLTLRLPVLLHLPIALKTIIN